MTVLIDEPYARIKEEQKRRAIDDANQAVATLEAVHAGRYSPVLAALKSILRSNQDN